MNIRVKVIHAFSAGDKGGNPAGVVFNADELTHENKQFIAAKAGFPETAFVSASDRADFKLEFFTPVRQIPHCGHATIATFTYLKQAGKILADHSSKETIDGIRSIFFTDHNTFMEQKAPVLHVPLRDIPAILYSLGLTQEDLKADQQPTIVNTGNSFLLVPVKNEKVLKEISYRSEEVYTISESHNLIGFYVYAFPEGTSDVDATARMFAPYYGIEEEAGTGMAAGPLASFLYLKEKNKKDKMIIEQGRFMRNPSPSLIHVHLHIEQGKIVRLFAGGNAYVAGEIIVKL